MAKQSREDLLRKKREKERERRKQIREDPLKWSQQQQKEKEKYNRQKQNKVKKLIKDMTPRERRTKRRQWKRNSMNYYHRQRMSKEIQQKIQENTPPNSSDEADNSISTIDNRVLMGIKRANRNKVERYRRKKKMENDIQKLQKKVFRLKKKYDRLKKKCATKPKTSGPLTPLSRTNLLMEEAGFSNTRNQEAVQQVKKKILFGEVVQNQLQHTYGSSKCQRPKQIIKNILSGNIIRKYGLKRYCAKQIKYRNLSPEKCQTDILAFPRKDKSFHELRKRVISFLEEDCNSKMAPGKKDCITRKKVTKQKRYLADTMKNLHRKFVGSCPENQISYAFFCRSRPFWIVTNKVENRDTCMCTKHANFELLVHSLFTSGVVETEVVSNLIKNYCCDNLKQSKEDCLFRKCILCKDKRVTYKQFDENKNVKYLKWSTKKEDYLDKKTNQQKTCSKTVKEAFVTTLGLLIQKYEIDLTEFMAHQGRIFHQYGALSILKKNLNNDSILIHCDFSENYNLKYAKETQAFHFGGSRQQITLHTVVVYKNTGNGVTPLSYCTVSECLKHDVPAIWAHLFPVIKSALGNSSTIHFLSDSPATQYRNKLMFSFLANSLQTFFPQINTVSWNYHESGHGKGAPDGIGGVCKRTADRIVAQGADLDSIKTLVHILEENCPKIKFFHIKAQDIDDVKCVVDNNQVKVFQGTMKVHQVVKDAGASTIWFRSLSCFSCANDCIHYGIGCLTYAQTLSDSEFSNINCNKLDKGTKKAQGKVHYRDVYSDSDDETEIGLIKNFSTSQIKTGSHILVEVYNESRRAKYRYIAVCVSDLDEEDGEVKVTYLEVCGNNGKLFKLNEKDTSYTSFDQILAILPEPTVVCKGNRIYYSFPAAIDVFEK